VTKDGVYVYVGKGEWNGGGGLENSEAIASMWMSVHVLYVQGVSQCAVFMDSRSSNAPHYGDSLPLVSHPHHTLTALLVPHLDQLVLGMWVSVSKQVLPARESANSCVDMRLNGKS